MSAATLRTKGREQGRGSRVEAGVLLLTAMASLLGLLFPRALLDRCIKQATIDRLWRDDRTSESVPKAM